MVPVSWGLGIYIVEAGRIPDSRPKLVLGQDKGAAYQRWHPLVYVPGQVRGYICESYNSCLHLHLHRVHEHFIKRACKS